MVLKVIELLAESQESWEAATQVAVKEAAKTLRGIRRCMSRSSSRWWKGTASPPPC